MYVVGAGKLRSFWEKHPESESALRALQAVLAESEWRTQDAMIKALGDVAKLADDEIEITLPWCATRVALRSNCAAGVILIERAERIKP